MSRTDNPYDNAMIEQDFRFTKLVDDLFRSVAFLWHFLPPFICLPV